MMNNKKKIKVKNDPKTTEPVKEYANKLVEKEDM
jgi:hypothetical protein